MTISIAEAILQGANSMRKAGVPEARREAGSLLAHLLGRDRTYILGHAEDPITPEQFKRFREFVRSRSDRKPLQYITGHQEFFSLDFEVTSDVLIPRPETELLVEAAIKLVTGLEGPSICDVGTGSGCIAISLLHELLPARAIAIDVSASALEIAKRNAARHGVSERIEFVLSDCFAEVDPKLQFDLIVSNPPYVKDGDLDGLQREVRDYEPRVALEAGMDGLVIIRRLLSQSGPFLKTGGHLLFEIGFDQGEAVEQLIDRSSWKLLEIHPDLQGIPRIVALRKSGQDPTL